MYSKRLNENDQIEFPTPSLLLRAELLPLHCPALKVYYQPDVHQSVDILYYNLALLYLQHNRLGRQF
ncbi:hypothetical protein [Commensalibacter communis]|uniref:hypothetical protein n=1 Tax=Commensalibacter communis TaxID=2972786 RepID=UPI00232CFB12|nr:hypothetical protein [Commensalibacter communis]